MNQTISYALIGTLGLISLLITLRALTPLASDVEKKVETSCANSVLSTISNLISSAVGGGSVEGIVFTPFRVNILASGNEVSTICGESKITLEFPFEIEPLNASVKGLVKIKAFWTGKSVKLVISGEQRA